MWPVIGGLISGGANLLGGMFSANQSAQNVQNQIAAQEQMQQQTMSFNAQQAANQQFFQANEVDQQQAYETQMSNTAYQRASKDMVAAGLNPMMMFGSGGAASTPSTSAPSGSAASVGTPTVPMPNKQSALAGLGQSVSSAIDSMTRVKLMDKMTEEIANVQADTAKTDATTKLIKGQQKIQDPEVRAAIIRMGYPDWLANSLTYGGDISKGLSSAGDAVWSLIPGGKIVRNLVGGSSAKSQGSVAVDPGSDKAFSASQNQRIQDLIRQNNQTSSAKSTLGAGGRPSKEMVDEFQKNWENRITAPYQAP